MAVNTNLKSSLPAVLKMVFFLNFLDYICVIFGDQGSQGLDNDPPSEPCLWCASESERENKHNSMNEDWHRQQKALQHTQHFSAVNKHITSKQTVTKH